MATMPIFAAPWAAAAVAAAAFDARLFLDAAGDVELLARGASADLRVRAGRVRDLGGVSPLEFEGSGRDGRLTGSSGMATMPTLAALRAAAAVAAAAFALRLHLDAAGGVELLAHSVGADLRVGGAGLVLAEGVALGHADGNSVGSSSHDESERRHGGLQLSDCSSAALLGRAERGAGAGMRLADGFVAGATLLTFELARGAGLVLAEGVALGRP